MSLRPSHPPMKTILVPVDFSRGSHDVVDAAIALAAAINGRIVVLHVVPPPPIVADLAPLAGEALQFTAEVGRAARQHLQRWQQSLEKHGVAVEAVCRDGAPGPMILKEADQRAADYIVIGSHGHTAFYDLVVGSTTSAVVKRATCPVIVVPSRRDAKTRRPHLGRPPARRRASVSRPRQTTGESSATGRGRRSV